MPKSTFKQTPLQVVPEPALEQRTRRTYTADYKLNVITEADACKHGELGALLRREKLYSGQLANWRRELARHGIEGLSKTAPGPKASKTPEQRLIEKLEKENTRLKRKLKNAHDCLDLQKKVLSLLDHTSSGSEV